MAHLGNAGIFSLIAALLISCPVSAAPIVFSASATDVAGLSPSVDAFRSTLGALNPNAAGSFGSGRREINWDGVPDTFAAPNMLPANFFNVNSPRGVVFSTPGTGFQVSATSASGTPAEFGNINPGYPAEFAAFSPQRLFTSIGSNIIDVSFFIAGTTVGALTNGFGAVFSDVDLANTSSIEFFDVNNVAIFSSFIQPSIVAHEGLSFLGVTFSDGAVISRVRITSGNAVAGATETAGVDIVVMDDFIYGEPVPLAPVSVPEPAHTASLGFALLGLFLWRRKKVVSGR